MGLLKSYLSEALSEYEKVTVFSGAEHFAPHILCFSLEGIRGEVLVHAFEEKQIYLSQRPVPALPAKKMASSTLHAMHVLVA